MNSPEPEHAPRQFGAWLFAKACALFGVDEIQFRTLLRTCLWIDFRGSAQAAGAGRSETPLKSALMIYALYSALLALMAVVVPLGLYTRIMMFFGMTILGMIMLVDFGVTLIVPDDTVILGWRPVSSRTYFAVRVTNTLLFIAAFALALFTIPAIAGAFARGSSVWFPFVFLPCTLLAAVFITGIIAASYAILLRWFSQERFRDTVNYLQVGMMILLLVGSQIGPRLEREKFRHAGTALLDTAQWSVWDILPPRWFAAPAEAFVSGWNVRLVSLSVLALVSTFALFVFLLRSLSLSYLENISGARVSPAGTRNPLRTGLQWETTVERFFHAGEEKAMFDFIRKVATRDRQIRLRLYPTLVYFLILPLFMFTSSSELTGLLARIAPLVMLTLPSTVILQLLPYAGESQGSWVFELAGLPAADRVASGIKKTIIAVFHIPLALVLFAALSFFLGIGMAAACTFFGLAAGILLLNVMFLLFFEDLPFSRPMPAGRAAGGFGYSMLGLLFAAVAGFLTYYFLGSVPRLIAASVVLLFAAFLANREGNKRYRPLGFVAERDSPVQLISVE